MKGKKAVIGDGILMIYRIILVVIIAFVVMALSAVFYSYYIDVRYSEAGILAKDVVNCLSPQGELNLSQVNEYETKILDYCKIINTERFYVKVLVIKDGIEIKKLEHGDSGSLWVKQIFENNQGKNIQKYEPGYFNQTYHVSLNKLDTTLYVETLVNNEL